MAYAWKAIAVGLLFVPVAAGAPEPPLPMSQVVRGADLIVVGTLANVQVTESSDDGRDYSAVVVVADTLYGQAVGRVQLRWGSGRHLCEGFFDLEKNASVPAVWLLRGSDAVFTIDHHKSVIYLSTVVVSAYRYSKLPEAIAELAESPEAQHDEKVKTVLTKLKALVASRRT